MPNRRNISRITLLAELGSRMIVSSQVLIAIVVGATSVYPQGFIVMFATAGAALVIEAILILRAVFYILKPSAYNLTNKRGGLLIFIQLLLLVLFIIAALWAFRDYSKEPGYASRAQAAIYDRRIACGVLIMASLLFQIVPTMLTIAILTQSDNTDIVVSSKNG